MLNQNINFGTIINYALADALCTSMFHEIGSKNEKSIGKIKQVLVCTGVGFEFFFYA